MKRLNVEKLRAAIDARVETDIAETRVGGAEVLVRQNGEVVFAKRYGVRRVGGEPLGENEIYRLASMTKPVTACAVGIEWGRGRLELDDPITKFLPEFAEMTVAREENGQPVADHPACRLITVRDLLNHASGIGTWELGCKAVAHMTSEDRVDMKTAASFYAKCLLGYDPGTQCTYSPTASFDVAARIVEITSGMDIHEYLRKNIFEPLGMNDTTTIPTEDQWKRTITMYNRSEAGEPLNADNYDHVVFLRAPKEYFAGGAGLMSTAADYSRFAEMLLNDGKAPDGRQVVPMGWIRMMQLPQVPVDIMSGSMRWGLGVRVIVNDQNRLPDGCFGWSGAFGTHFWVDPANHITAVYMKNSLYDGGSGAETAAQFEEDVVGALED